MAQQNNHYLAIREDRKILGHIYARSRIIAQNWLNENYSGTRALLFSSCSQKKSKNDPSLPILLGQPSLDKPSIVVGHRRSVTLSGLSDQAVALLDSQDKKGIFMSDLLENEARRRQKKSNTKG